MFIQKKITSPKKENEQSDLMHTIPASSFHSSDMFRREKLNRRGQNYMIKPSTMKSISGADPKGWIGVHLVGLFVFFYG